ncbi:MAG: HAMP domain-containing histidine kinase [Gammaproteobacteria bacterium]|nr:HAMP domain-containing histidine kinase [Gammaproteobacteria bacterium]
MIRLPNTLAFRLTFWYTLVVIILIMIAFSASYLSLKKKLNYNLENDLIEDILEYKILYKNEGLDGIKQEIEQEMEWGEEKNFFFQLFDRNGIQIYSSDLSHWKLLPESPHIIKHVFSSKNFVLQTTNIQGKEYKAKTIYGLISPNILLHTGESTESIQNTMTLLSNVFIGMFLIVIPIAFVIGWLMAGHAVKGIKEVSRIASEIEKGKLDRRVSVSSQRDEITQLVNTFNAMLDRIKVLIFEMKEMTDNIAHDLRSPLARIRVISELALSNNNTPKNLKSSASDIIEECDRLLQMINSTLDVAEAEADTFQTTKKKVDISQLAQDACEIFEPMAEQKHIRLACRLDNNCYIYGNIQNLQRMFANLLDNAIKYTLANGQVDVILTRSRQNIEIMIIDTGIGIPENDQARVFDRFFRCDQSRTHDGCGLGLSFARAVARSHGGDIDLSSRLKNGSCFTIRLPATNLPDS